MPKAEYSIVKKHFIKLIPDILKEINELSEGNRGYCYSISELARRLFQSCGISSQVAFVRGVIENEISENLRKVIPIESPEFLPALKSNGGYTMGVGIGKDCNGTPNFHAVLYFPEQNEILDMTTKLFHRPLYNIYMPDWFYGSYEDYFKMYSDGFPKVLCKFPEFGQTFNPMIDREPKCKDIIRRYKKLLNEKVGA